MATRSGGATVAMVGRLQEARHSLEKQLGFPVACSTAGDLFLLAFPRTDDDKAKLAELRGRWRGFRVEEREAPQAP